MRDPKIRNSPEHRRIAVGVFITCLQIANERKSNLEFVETLQEFLDVRGLKVNASDLLEGILS